MGVTVLRISLRGKDVPLVDDLDFSERALTRYVLAAGYRRLMGAFAWRLISQPRATIAALKLALKMWGHSDRSLLVHFAYVVEACKIAKWLEAEGIQHLHAHFCTNSAEVAMHCRRFSAVPYSFTAHGSDLVDKPTLEGLSEKTDDAKFVAAVCSFGRSQLFRWIPFESWKKIQVVRCGLDDESWSPISMLQAKSQRIVCIGRLSKEKGQVLLLEAIKMLKVDGQLVHLTLVGDGPMRDEIEQLRERYSLNNDVVLTGSLDSKQVRQSILNSDALVLSSLSEGLPVVIMEAMALKRTVIAPYLGGIPELVSHGTTGWLFPAGDSRALADAIREFIATDLTRLQSMGENAEQRVRSLHYIDDSARQLLELMTRKKPIQA